MLCTDFHEHAGMITAPQDCIAGAGRYVGWAWRVDNLEWLSVTSPDAMAIMIPTRMPHSNVTFHHHCRDVICQPLQGDLEQI